MSNPKESIITEEVLKKLKTLASENPSLQKFAHTVGGAVVKATDKGKIRGLAVQAMEEQTNIQLNQIAQQMEVLANQYKDIKVRAEISYEIYSADISFTPLIGQIYYLYRRSNDSDLLSMIGPCEWGEKLPYKQYLATVKLLADHTWEVLEYNSEFK